MTTIIFDLKEAITVQILKQAGIDDVKSL